MRVLLVSQMSPFSEVINGREWVLRTQKPRLEQIVQVRYSGSPEQGPPGAEPKAEANCACKQTNHYLQTEEVRRQLGRPTTGPNQAHPGPPARHPGHLFPAAWILDLRQHTLTGSRGLDRGQPTATWTLAVPCLLWSGETPSGDGMTRLKIRGWS